MVGRFWELCRGINCDPMESERRRAFADGLPAPDQVPPARSFKCVHLGEATGDKVQCIPCGGNIQIKLYACEIYTTCTLVKKLDGITCCNGCKDYKTE